MDSPNNQNPQSPVKKSQRIGRVVGFLMFIGGGALAYLALVLPLQAASRHEEDISLWMKGVALVPGLLVLGSILVFMGNERASRLFGTREQPTVRGVVICLLMAGAGILLY